MESSSSSSLPLQVCSEGKWLQNRLQVRQNESRSLLAVDIQGHQCGCFCIVPTEWNELVPLHQCNGFNSSGFQFYTIKWKFESVLRRGPKHLE